MLHQRRPWVFKTHAIASAAHPLAAAVEQAQNRVTPGSNLNGQGSKSCHLILLAELCKLQLMFSREADVSGFKFRISEEWEPAQPIKEMFTALWDRMRHLPQPSECSRSYRYNTSKTLSLCSIR